MKATMMKVSDPIIFGHAVKVFFFKDLFTKHGDVHLKTIGVDVNNGLGIYLSKLNELSEEKRSRN